MSTASVTNTFVNAATADAGEVNTNFSDLVTFLNGSVVHTDGSKAFTGNVSGITPTAAAHLARKDYVDAAEADAESASQALLEAAVKTTILYNSGDWSLTSGTTVQYPTWDSESVDDGGWHSGSLGTIIPDVKGIYLVQAQINFNSLSATGYRHLFLQNNGVNFAHVYSPGESASSSEIIQIVGVGKIATAGHAFRLGLRQNSGGTLTIAGGAPNISATWFAVTRLGGSPT